MAWREASTLIIAARMANSGNKPANLSSTIEKGTNIPTFDYNILMVKRSQRSSFMASNYVFPGGVVDPCDYSSRWWLLFDRLGHRKDDLVKQIGSRVTVNRPTMITNPISIRPSSLQDSIPKNDHLIPDIALRIAAIRETFEETGLFVLFDPASSSSFQPIDENVKDELIKWRAEVRKDGQAFIDMCSFLGKLPDIWSLYEWWNWSTPKFEGSKRFDTMFYIHCLDHQPQVILDNAEVTNFKWESPTEILREFAEKKIILAPPQIFELARIVNLRTLEDLQKFAAEREKLGVQRWLPIIEKKPDGRYVFLPGDIFYPEDPEAGLQLNDVQVGNEEEIMKSGKIVNRFKSKENVFSYISNHDSCGHFKPIFDL